MTTQSPGWATTIPRGGRTSGRTGRGGGRTKGRSNDQGNGRIDGQGVQVGGQGIEVNDGVDGVPNFFTVIAQQLQNLLPTILAKGGAIVYTCWIKKMESVQDMSGCRDNQMVKYFAGSFVGKALM
nr:reverse transcriptase domain-containing protein [Tanacetum cinerariifolium]